MVTLLLWNALHVLKLFTSLLKSENYIQKWMEVYEVWKVQIKNPVLVTWNLGRKFKCLKVTLSSPGTHPHPQHIEHTPPSVTSLAQAEDITYTQAVISNKLMNRLFSWNKYDDDNNTAVLSAYVVIKNYFLQRRKTRLFDFWYNNGHYNIL